MSKVLALRISSILGEVISLVRALDDFDIIIKIENFL